MWPISWYLKAARICRGQHRQKILVLLLLLCLVVVSGGLDDRVPFRLVSRGLLIWRPLGFLDLIEAEARSSPVVALDNRRSWEACFDSIFFSLNDIHSPSTCGVEQDHALHMVPLWWPIWEHNWVINRWFNPVARVLILSSVCAHRQRLQLLLISPECDLNQHRLTEFLGHNFGLPVFLGVKATLMSTMLLLIWPGHQHGGRIVATLTRGRACSRLLVLVVHFHVSHVAPTERTTSIRRLRPWVLTILHWGAQSLHLLSHLSIFSLQKTHLLRHLRHELACDDIIMADILQVNHVFGLKTPIFLRGHHNHSFTILGEQLLLLLIHFMAASRNLWFALGSCRSTTW